MWRANCNSSTCKRWISVCSLVYLCCANSKCPSQMCKFLVRSTRSSASHLGLLSVPCHNLSFGSHAFRISDPKIWNSLPPHILQSQTLSSFIRHLKPTTFSQPTLLSSTHPNTPWFSSETLAVYKSFTYLSSLSLYRLLFIRCKELAHKNLVQQSMSDVQVSCCTSQPLQVSWVCVMGLTTEMFFCLLYSLLSVNQLRFIQ